MATIRFDRLDPHAGIAPEADFAVENHGSIFLLRPLTDQANDWADAHLPDDAQTFGGAIAVEHRFIFDIVAGIQADGLAVR